jgi:hypothetical protein
VAAAAVAADGCRESHLPKLNLEIWVLARSTGSSSARFRVRPGRALAAALIWYASCVFGIELLCNRRQSQTRKRRQTMVNQVSFTQFENEMLPDFRSKLSAAETSEEVKTHFAQATTELLIGIFPETSDRPEAPITLAATEEPFYSLSRELKRDPHFTAVWNASDLPRVIARLAKSAANRCRHLEKHPEKTEAKIRM